MPLPTIPKFSLKALASWITGIGVLAGAVITIETRYNNKPTLDALEGMRAQVITEIAANRSVLISIMQNEADDLEFEIMNLEANDQTVPRYMLEKFRRITREIEELKENEDVNQTPSN